MLIWAFPSDIGKSLYGWGPFGEFLVESPPDLVETEYGCMICAKQAFRVPSDSAQTEDGCRASTRQAFSPHPIWRQAEKDGKSAGNVPDKRTRKL